MSGFAAWPWRSFAFSPQTSKRQIHISLFDAFVSKIANQDGLRPMQKSVATTKMSTLEANFVYLRRPKKIRGNCPKSPQRDQR
jgi:hypothetical protein